MVVPQSSHLGADLRVMSSGGFGWTSLVQVSFQHQRTLLEGAAQEQMWFSVGEVAMKEVKKGNYPVCNRCIHALVVSCHRAWPHLGPTQQVCPIKSELSIRESQ